MRSAPGSENGRLNVKVVVVVRTIVAVPAAAALPLRQEQYQRPH
jgi:hypothetical protein